MANQNETINDAPEAPEVVALREMRAKRAAFDEARASKLAETPAQVLARETREFADAEAYAAAQDTYGAENVDRVKTRYGDVVLRKPSKISHQRFSELPKIKSADIEKYVGPSRCHPDHVAFDKIVEQLPHTLVECMIACNRLAGLKKDEEEAK